MYVGGHFHNGVHAAEHRRNFVRVAGAQPLLGGIYQVPQADGGSLEVDALQVAAGIAGGGQHIGVEVGHQLLKAQVGEVLDHVAVQELVHIAGFQVEHVGNILAGLHGGEQLCLVLVAAVHLNLNFHIGVLLHEGVGQVVGSVGEGPVNEGTRQGLRVGFGSALGPGGAFCFGSSAVGAGRSGGRGGSVAAGAACEHAQAQGKGCKHRK